MAGANGIRADFGPYRTPELVDAFGKPLLIPNDPAFPKPQEPTRNVRDQINVISREIPAITTQTGYSPADVRGAIEQLVIGLFDLPSQMTDTVLADSRVSATMASRTGGLLGRPCTFHTPPGYEDDAEAKLARAVWRDHWSLIFPEAIASEFLRWHIMQGFGIAQIPWNVEGKWLIPEPMIWHPRYSYYHWLYRCYVAVTQDGQEPITPGDGHWVLQGGYRSWMRGSVWPIGPWWLARQYTLRDWARYCERHGMPIILAKTPAAADPASIAAFRSAMQKMGQETVVQLPQGVEQQYSYALDLLEATDQGWQGFHQLIEQCNTEITLALMGQNLTTEVKEGSFAAARVHADVRQTLLEADARALERTIYEQIARPFAAMNWGRPEIAPITRWDLRPYEDAETAAKTFLAFAEGIAALRKVGKDVSGIRELAETFGLDLKMINITEAPPLQGGSGGSGGGLGGGGKL
jgi:phage gp29-like protein